MIYIGDKKIKETFDESDLVRVVFEDDSGATFTKKMYEASFSQEPLDATQLQERRIVAVQTEFMGMLLGWNMKLVDIQRMLQMTSNFIAQKHEFAEEKLFGNNYLERTIGDIERVLSENNSI